MCVKKPVDPLNLTINLKHNNTTVSRKEKLASALPNKEIFIFTQKTLLHLLPTKVYQTCYQSKILLEVFTKLDVTYDSETIIELTRKAYLITTISSKAKNCFTTKAIFLQHKQQENIEQKM